MKEDFKTIKAFVEYLREHGYPEIQITEQPDEIEREKKAIDAIACPFAIEHTSIDILKGQRMQSAWFEKCINGLEQELRAKISFRLSITLEYKAIGKGQNWEKIRNALSNWIIKESPRLQDGKHVIANIPEIPFQFRLTKESGRPSGVFFSREIPSDNTLHERIKEQLDRKIAKLKEYDGAKITLLLIENADFALMDLPTLRDVLQKAYPEGFPVNEIWFADTSIADNIEFKDMTRM